MNDPYFNIHIDTNIDFSELARMMEQKISESFRIDAQLMGPTPDMQVANTIEEAKKELIKFMSRRAPDIYIDEQREEWRSRKPCGFDPHLGPPHQYDIDDYVQFRSQYREVLEGTITYICLKQPFIMVTPVESGPVPSFWKSENIRYTICTDRYDEIIVPEDFIYRRIHQCF